MYCSNTMFSWLIRSWGVCGLFVHLVHKCASSLPRRSARFICRPWWKDDLAISARVWNAWSWRWFLLINVFCSHRYERVLHARGSRRGCEGCTGGYPAAAETGACWRCCWYLLLGPVPASQTAAGSNLVRQRCKRGCFSETWRSPSSFPNPDFSASFRKSGFTHRIGLQVAFGRCFGLSFGTCCWLRGRGQRQNIWGLSILPPALKEKVNSYRSSDLCLWLVANFTLRKIIL